MTDEIKLRPVEFRKKYMRQIAQGMSDYFAIKIFNPISDILLSNNTIFNDNNKLLEALQSGRIYYQYGAFRSKYNYSNEVALELEQMGAKYRNGAYYLEANLIPLQYKSVIDSIKVRTMAKLAQINSFLIGLGNTLSKVTVEQFIETAVKEGFRQLQIDIVRSAVEKKVPVIELGIVNPKVSISKPDAKKLKEYWKTTDKKIDDLKKEIKDLKEKKKNKGTSNPPPPTNKDGKTLEDLKKELADIQANKYANAPNIDINIPKLDEQSKKIAEDYTYNMKWWVQKWEAKNIVKMREDIVKMMQEGATPATVQEYFMKRWGIAKRKAAFLAQNESDLCAAVIKKNRYIDMGSDEFEWGESSTKEADRRKLHEEYYGKRFRYDNPPIIDEILGLKGLPREIWNCRCHQIPVINRIGLLEKIDVKRNLFKKIKNAIQNSTQRNNNPWRYRRFGEG